MPELINDRSIRVLSSLSQHVHEKLEAYALGASHERGRHKARVFASALGITAADWRYLHDEILRALPDAPVRSTRITSFGVAYEVVVTIDGLNGATRQVVTTWIIECR